MLHGDFFPGAWVYGNDGVKVIDSEFCLFGPPEFDLGVMVAHLIVAGDEVDAPNALSAAYQSASGGAVDAALVGRFAGIELWRRLHGVAPLPAPPIVDIPFVPESPTRPRSRRADTPEE